MDNDQDKVSRRRKDKKAHHDRPSVSILLPGIRFPLRILLPPNNSCMSQTPLDGCVEDEETNDSALSSPLVAFNSLSDERSPLSVSPSGSVDISKFLIESPPNCRGVASGQVNKRRRSRSKNRKKECTLVEECADEIGDEPPVNSKIESSSTTKMYIKSNCTPNELIYQEVSYGDSSTTDTSNSTQPYYSQTMTSTSTENFIREMISAALKVGSQTAMRDISEPPVGSKIQGEDLPIPLGCVTDLKESAKQNELSKLGTSHGGQSNRNLIDASVLTIGNSTNLDRSDTCCQTDKSADIYCRSVQTCNTESPGLPQTPPVQETPNKSNSQRVNQEKLSSRTSCDEKKVSKTRRSNASGGKSNDKRRTSLNVRIDNARDKGSKSQDANNSNKLDEEKDQLPKKRENSTKGVIKNKQNRNDLKNKKFTHPTKASSAENVGEKAENKVRSGCCDKPSVKKAPNNPLEPLKRKSNESIGIRIIHVNNNYEESTYLDSETEGGVSLHDVGRTSEEKLHIKDLFTESLQHGATGIVIQDAVSQNPPNRRQEPVKRKIPHVKFQEAGSSKKEEFCEKPKTPEPQPPRVSNVKKPHKRTAKPENPRLEFNLVEEIKRILTTMWTMLYIFWTTYV